MEHDEHCKSCAYRVSDRRFADTCVLHVFVCLHPEIGRMDCANARHPNKQCGPTHKLWEQHSARKKLAVQDGFYFEPSNAPNSADAKRSAGMKG